MSRVMFAEPSRIGEHDGAALAVLAQDLVGTVAFPHLGDVPHGHPAIGRLDQQVAEAVASCVGCR